VINKDRAPCRGSDPILAEYQWEEGR